MQQIVKMFLLSIATFILHSCDYVKEAYNETFNYKDKKEREIDLREIFDKTFDLEKDYTNRNTENYTKVLSDLYPDLDSAKVRVAAEMITNSMQKGHYSGISLLFQPDKLDEIQAELYTFLNAENLLMYDPVVFVEYDRVRLRLLNPQNPKEADWYWYETGTEKWRKEDAVKISKSKLEKMEENTLPLSSIKLSAATKVMYQIISHLDELGYIEMPNSITAYIYSYKRIWTVQLGGERADYRLETDLEGNLLTLERL
ncbi:hypothetical protein ACF3NR_09675 [Vaginella massiliensis]|uniref:hypothetical protein n=1 Tax=Vaginella massiliensis TaxID=1816680 RepID=UPI003752082F